jgi:pyruvate dehydrogenase complex dehydrogenase (E1) component
MTFEQLNQDFTRVIAGLKGQPNALLIQKMGITALTLLRERVTKTGTNAEGKKFEGYSTKDTLVGRTTFYKDAAATKLLGSKAKRKELQWVTIGDHRLAVLKGGYKKIRELQGRQTAFVDFTVSGHMWTDISLISKAGDHQKGIAVIGAKEEKEKKKLEGNTKRKGDILDVSDREIDKLREEYNKGVLQIFRNNGL